MSMGIRVSAWEWPVGQYWILRCQHGAFHWEGQFHPPWGLIAGIRGGWKGERKLKGRGGGFEGTLHRVERSRKSLVATI